MLFIFRLRDNAIAEHYDRLRINTLVTDPDFASGIGVRVREFKLHSGFFPFAGSAGCLFRIRKSSRTTFQPTVVFPLSVPETIFSVSANNQA